MKNKHEVTRAEFIQAIKGFKQAHGKKLKELLTRDNPEAVREFWRNPVIRAYLGRLSVDFIDQHPLLKDSDNKNEHEHSDHYELKVYKYLPRDVFYRDESVAQSKFYTRGTTTVSKLDESESGSGYGPNQIYAELVKIQCLQNEDIKVIVGLDIYQIAVDIASYRTSSHKKPGPRFLIYAQTKDAHATTIVSVMEPVTGRSLASVFINSSNGKDYYEYINYRYGLEHDLRSDLMPASLKQIVNMRDKEEKTEIEIHKGESYACTWYGADIEAQRKALRESKDIDTYYMMDREFGNKFALTSPLIDASHNLQLAKDDKNCALYSLNFVDATSRLLWDPATRNRVYKLAESVKREPAAEQELVCIFQEELKQFLPQYYNQDTKIPVSFSELQDFHLKQRWLMGSLSIPIRHPLDKEEKSSGTVNEEKPSQSDSPVSPKLPLEQGAKLFSGTLHFWGSGASVEKPQNTDKEIRPNAFEF